MGLLDVFSLFVLLVIIAVGVAILLTLGWLLGNIARKRHSPWAEAINVAGWIGILLPPLWMLALVAAFVRPSVGEGAAIAINESESAELASTIRAISGRIANLEHEVHDSQPKAVGQRAGD